MKKRSTILTSVASLCAFMTLFSAAPGQAPDPTAQLESLAKQLELTPEQKGQMLPILKEEVPKLEAIKKDTSLSGFQKLRQLRSIHAESAPQVQKILNPDQYKKLQAIREEAIKKAIDLKRAGG